MPKRRKNWARYDDERLLDLSFRELGLKVERSPLEARVARLHDELADRGIRHAVPRRARRCALAGGFCGRLRSLRRGRRGVLTA